jgi:hypothetical protein
MNMRPATVLLFLLLGSTSTMAEPPSNLRQALTFYASFDE